jgi:hypothetical protein
MKTLKSRSALRVSLLLSFAGLALDAGAVLAADLPYDAQAQIGAVLSGAPRDPSAPRDQKNASIESREAASSVEFQALVRRFILSTPGSDVSQAQAAALAVPMARLDGRRYVGAQLLVQRTLQGGAG